MRFPDSFLDDIRDRLPISEVIGKRVTFDKKKTNAARGDYWACCPFHGEKTPSFHCEDRKGRYYCFGCGVSGDHFRFLTELDGLNFPEAVERLADQAGLPMPVMDERQREREEKRATLFDAMEMATAFFEQMLQSAEGAPARAYLRERGLSAETQKTFRIGFAPDSRNALKEHLSAKGIKGEQIEACGLVVHGEGIAVSYDRFRNRIMFPIPDARERVIAFGGRALSSDVPAKYLNSPETELFHKSNVLYNFARARRVVHERGQVIACEGYMDVLALNAAGFPNAVAPLGTALTERQMLLLWRLHGEPVLCFDGDEAGLKAAYRAIDTLLPGLEPGRSARFALLPDGLDPDDLIRQEGSEAMGEVLGNAVPLAEMIWNRETASSLFDTPERKAMLEKRIRQVIGTIGDAGVRRHYEQDMTDRLAVYFGASQERQAGRARGARRDGSKAGFRGGVFQQREGGRGSVSASPALLSTGIFKKGRSHVPLREAALVMGACNHPALIEAFFEEFVSLPLTAQSAEGLRQWLVDLHAECAGTGKAMTYEAIGGRLETSAHAETARQMEMQLTQNRIWQFRPDAAFEDALDGWRQAYSLHMRARSLRNELKAAEVAFSTDDSEENQERLNSIRAEIEREEGTEALIDGFGAPSGRPMRAL
ncbi:DNA primase [Salaquimonas pukyongi]|uniref:DNA primase n=1 Tax=Salaquimonas pukyongi TaxID=2712698 RepID=UPI00096B9AAC|nr:DNA primase [Salaquimonas pukyongi]